MSESNLSNSLAPPAKLGSSLSSMAQASESLYQLIHQFGNPANNEQLSPEVRQLFLNNYQSYAQLMGAQGQQLIYAITDVTTDIIKVGWAVQDLSDFLGRHLPDYRDGGFHLLLHYRTERKFSNALSGVETAISASQNLQGKVEDYHTEINRYIAQINTEFTQLAAGPGFVQQKFQRLVSELGQFSGNQYYDSRFGLLVEEAYQRYRQLTYENSNYFQAYLQQKIQSALNEYKNQALAITTALTGVGNSWNQLKDELNFTLTDLKKLHRAYPKSLLIVTKVDLKTLRQKWQEVHDDLVRMESSIISSS